MIQNHRRIPRRYGRSLLLAAAVLPLLLGGCSYYHRATVQGFVEDEATGTGINNATVRFYQEEPNRPSSSGFFARTSTSTSGGNPGYYRNTVVWDRYFSEFGAEGDSGTIYLGVTHPDYQGRVIRMPGILSDDINTLQTIQLQRVTFAAGEVYGRVIRAGDGSGVNGVRMVLTVPDLDDAGSPTGSEREYVAVTGMRTGESGWYSFDEPSWRDASTDPGGSSEVDARIEIDDPDWKGKTRSRVQFGLSASRIVRCLTACGQCGSPEASSLPP